MKAAPYIIGGIGLFVLTAILLRSKNKGGGSGGAWTPPVTGKLTSGFGLRKDPQNPAKEEGHNGQDIAVPIGTAVVSPRAGKVISTTATDAGGNQVVIQHDNGYYTGYAHLSKVLVNKGQSVSKGQKIALSGNTGQHTTGPHLHLTLTDPKGVKINPKPIIYPKA